ncbi:MAG: N-6 DNA methylase [Acidobacteria bacterium]|nr:N-6 DNA methylase [Acidobacteriota bacterium]
MRAKLGAYYTPPALCDRLLDMAEDAGVDWSTARVLDPACGGGAFLAPVALRMAESVGRDLDRSQLLKEIARRLVGFELDAFAAWMSQVFLDIVLAERVGTDGELPEPSVRMCDSLEVESPGEGFDLVVGNPPYGRVKLSSRLPTVSSVCPFACRTPCSRSRISRLQTHGLGCPAVLQAGAPSRSSTMPTRGTTGSVQYNVVVRTRR